MIEDINNYIYNLDEKALLGAFFAEISDITIYVEDTAVGMRNFYKKLLEKKFPKITIDNIIPLGKKSDVIKACKERPFTLLNEIYIIDGDLDLLLSKKINQKCLFQHNVYCIENYLFDEEAISNFISDELGTIDDIKIIKNLLNLNNFFNEFFSPFAKIYKLFAIIYKNKLNIPTISRFNSSIYLYKKNSYITLNQEQLEIEYHAVEKLIISNIGYKEFKEELTNIENIMKSLTLNDLKKIISGKNELLFLLKNYSHFIAKNLDKNCNNITGINSSSLKIKLAKYTKHENLEELYNAIEKTIKNGYYDEAS
ncbi:DUF4435 domain-containing protein [Acinetobacter nosocomialis]|uniref:DUF4435 domain-containing protein n=1 Tax=Acinetobacter nosocomialis TaxID=106654 RepID=UPI0026FC5C1F|nr:DUF4435 domain-containing protein [Acinetobacter nosocomialis]MDO7540226.1 DUF4435 domain-containing protein [Acinetobacter nosocomialis]